MNWFWNRRRDAAEEIQSHINERADELAASGVPPAEASQQARREFGNATLITESSREIWGWIWLDRLGQDLRYAVRVLRRSPGFTAVAVLSLALGIGANTAIFSLLDAVILKSLPVNEPERLVQVRLGAQRELVSHPIWEQIRELQQVFTSTLAYGTQAFNLATGGESQLVSGLFVSGNYFDVLGVKAILGRILTAEDDVSGDTPSGEVALISYSFWQSHYGGQRDIIGKTTTLDGHLFTIVGVTERRFFGMRVGTSFDVAVPLRSAPVITGQVNYLDQRNTSWLRLVGRLKPDVSIDAAEAHMRTLQPRIREVTMPPGAGADLARNYLKDPFTLSPGALGSSPLRERYAQALLVLMIIVGLVLFVACANIASLVLARAETRTREIAIRRAVGASRARLIRQLLIESVVLGLCGAVIGLGFANWSSHLLVLGLSTGANSVFLDLTLNWRIFGFALGAGGLTSVLFGLVPAIRATRRTPSESWREMACNAGGLSKRVGAGRWLVSLQAGLSLVLIFGAVLFIRSYWSLLTLDPGFKTAEVLLINADFRQTAKQGTGDVPSLSFYNQILEALRVVPGVRAVTYSMTTPMGDESEATNIQVEGYEPQSENDLAFLNVIGPGYFDTLGTALIAGRDFDARDAQNTGEIAIVNEAFAKKFFPSQNPVGRLFQIPGPRGLQGVRIVGLVQNAKYHNMRETIPPTFYERLSGVLGPRLVFSAKTSVPPMSVAPAVGAAIRGINKNISFTTRTFQSQIDDSLVQERLIAILSAFFGALALVIAAVGLAGLVSYSVSRRRSEIGIRAALGATPRSLVRLVMQEVLLITGVGLVFGWLLSFAGGRLIARMLYQVSLDDPITLVFASGALILAAAIAGYIPARRAARIDPMQCLRLE